MGVFARPDSKFFWLYLPTAPPGQRKEKTAVLVGTTATERRDNKLLAQQVYAQRMTELAARIHRLPSARPGMKFGVYAAVYAVDVLAHQRGHIRALEILTQLRRAFDGYVLSAIDQELVRAYMTQRRATCAPRTINREVAVLKGMLRDAVPKYLDANPLAGMKMLRAETPQRRLLQPDEEQRLLAVGDPVDRALLILGIDTLMRMGDLLDLKRSDQKGVWLTVRDPKGGRAYEVPLSKRAAAALKALKPDTTDGGYFFAKFRKAENPRDWRSSVRQRLEYLCKMADPPVPFGRKAHGISFHWGTRRTGATRLLVQRRQPVPIVKQLGNWKRSEVLLEIYTEAQRADLLAAVGQGKRKR
jgi:integrase